LFRKTNENHVSVKAFHRIILRGCKLTVERLLSSVISDGSIQKFTPRRAFLLPALFDSGSWFYSDLVLACGLR
jgi:hypothetical protein